jgi:lipid-binding SYLF domain-containing protein
MTDCQHTLETPVAATSVRSLSRRFAMAAIAMATVFSLAAPMKADAAPRPDLDADVQVAISELTAMQPEVASLFDQAEAVLVIPEVIKAGLVVGGAYGEGALIKNGATDSYWSYGAASIGYQLGAQKTRQAMFFMTPTALSEFEANNGFEIGADAEVTVLEAGAEVAVDTTKQLQPIIVIVYGREGLLGGVSLQGGKYTRLD